MNHPSEVVPSVVRPPRSLRPDRPGGFIQTLLLRYDLIYRDSVILTERSHMRPPGKPHGEHGHHGHWAGGRVPKGNVRGLLLAALLDGPAHGYELMRRLEGQASGRWRPSPGSV